MKAKLEEKVSITQIAERYVAAHEPYKGKKLLILLTGFLDPDNMSWGAAEREYCKRNGIEATIVHVHPVSRDDNRAMVKILEIEMKRHSEDAIAFEEYDAYCLGDSQTPDQELVPLLGNKPAALIMDHHKPRPDIDVGLKNVFIDTKARSTATMLGEIYQEIGFFNKHNEADSRIATGLIYGIYSDTGKFIRARHREVKVYAFLTDKDGGRGSLDIVERIGTQGISPQELDIMVRAHTQSIVKDNYLLAGVGVVNEGYRNAIGRGADFVLQRKGADTVFIYGVVDDEVDCSFRTTADPENPRESIQRVFPDVKITGEYGGSVFMGGFQFKLGTILNGLLPTDPERVVEVVDLYMQKQFHNSLGARLEDRATQETHVTE